MLLEDLSDVLGMSCALSLAIAFAGERLYVPLQVGSEHEIAAVLGLPKAQELAKIFGAQYLEFPKINRAGRKMDRKLRNFQHEKIREAMSLGYSQRDCGKIFGLSPRMIRLKEKSNNFRLDKPRAKALGCEQLDFGIFV